MYCPKAIPNSPLLTLVLIPLSSFLTLPNFCLCFFWIFLPVWTCWKFVNFIDCYTEMLLVTLIFLYCFYYFPRSLISALILIYFLRLIGFIFASSFFFFKVINTVWRHIFSFSTTGFQCLYFVPNYHINAMSYILMCCVCILPS